MSGAIVHCPHCHSPHRQIKWGRTPAGSQKHRCHACKRVYTSNPRPVGYPAETRAEAIRLYRAGLNCRTIGRALGVHHQSVLNWLCDASAIRQISPHPVSVAASHVAGAWTQQAIFASKTPTTG